MGYILAYLDYVLFCCCCVFFFGGGGGGGVCVEIMGIIIYKLAGSMENPRCGVLFAIVSSHKTQHLDRILKTELLLPSYRVDLGQLMI